MTEKQYKIITENAPTVIQSIVDMIYSALRGGPVLVTLGRESDTDKTRAQEKKYHAQIRDIAKQATLFDKTFSAKAWKVVLIEQFETDKKAMGEPLRHPGSVLLSMDGLRVVQERASSKEFLIKEGADFIEWLYSKGAELDVIWEDPETVAQYEDYLRIGHLSNGKQ